jgi:hypothetical protein
LVNGASSGVSMRLQLESKINNIVSFVLRKRGVDFISKLQCRDKSVYDLKCHILISPSSEAVITQFSLIHFIMHISLL